MENAEGQKANASSRGEKYDKIRCIKSISVSWFFDHRVCITLGGRIGTSTGCAGCRRVERAV